MEKANTQLVEELMNYGPGGMLQQPFILHAIRHYSQEVLNQDEEPEGWGNFISWEGWKRCAQHMIDELNKHGR